MMSYVKWSNMHMAPLINNIGACRMEKYYIITNLSKDKDLTVTNRIAEYLCSRGMTVKGNMVKGSINLQSESYTNPADIEDGTECVIVIGGDGTLIQAARDLRNKDIPMIGVNLGNLGFLAEIEKESVEETLDMLIRDDFTVESRMMLTGCIYRNGEKIQENIALNDIVFGRSGALRVVDFKVYVNQKFLKYYSADGIIITTPTGSTAYNLSAGGPILEPCANIIAITPICSHSLGSRSIVFSADSVIWIEICEDRHLEENETKVYFDGNASFALRTGDRIEITKSVLDTKIIKLNRMSFIEVLHKKLLS